MQAVRLTDACLTAKMSIGLYNNVCGDGNLWMSWRPLKHKTRFSMKHHAPRRLAAFVLAALAMLSRLPATPAAEVLIQNLRCECLTDPLGIDVEQPRLSWVMQDGGTRSEARGQKQTAFQMLVASSQELLAKDKGDLWDSGKVVSDQSIQVEYAGKPLESRVRCHWKVRVWDKDGTSVGVE